MTNCCAIIYVAFHIDNVGYFVQVPVHGIHGKAEHEHGEGSAHVNPLSYDSGWEELASDFVQDTSFL